MTFEWSPEENRCFGCGDNPWGLRLKFEEKGDWVVARTVLHDNYEGYKGVAHGGIVATLIDEAAGWAVLLKKELVAPSYDLRCQFRKQVPLGREIQVRGRIIDVRRRGITAEAQVLSNDGELLASGKVKCLLRKDVIIRHPIKKRMSDQA